MRETLSELTAAMSDCPFGFTSEYEWTAIMQDGHGDISSPLRSLVLLLMLLSCFPIEKLLSSIKNRLRGPRSLKHYRLSTPNLVMETRYNLSSPSCGSPRPSVLLVMKYRYRPSMCTSRMRPTGDDRTCNR